MARYEAHTHLQGPPEWCVQDNQAMPRFLRPCTEAEAHIIAWAFNKVAGGFGLYADTGTTSADGVIILETYDGPTEGVAP